MFFNFGPSIRTQSTSYEVPEAQGEVREVLESFIVWF